MAAEPMTEATILYQPVEAPAGYNAVEASISYAQLGDEPVKAKILYNAQPAIADGHKAEALVVYKAAAIGDAEAEATAIANALKVMAKVEAGEAVPAGAAWDDDGVEVLTKDQIERILVMEWPIKIARATPANALDTSMRFNPELAESIRRTDAAQVEEHKLLVVDEYCVVRDRYGRGWIPEGGVVIVWAGGR